ncbi:MAG: CDP-alcohol phosphatidyltransferase family protein [Candidatus Heimdallarchaeota archaeon]
MTEIIFEVIFPLILIGLLIIILISGIPNRKPNQQFMTSDDFIKDWLKDHGQAHKLEAQFNQMKKDPAGRIYMPITYKGAKIFVKWGLSPNKVSFMNLILSFLIFYCVVMLGKGTLPSVDLFSEQPFYGVWFLPLAILVLFTGIIDGIDGAIARLLNIKSKRGAWLDNVIDRISDTLMFVCLIPANFMVITAYGLNFRWIVWTNIFLIFIYEYMRARHEGLGMHETKPFVGERITRFLVTATFFAMYGISSLGVLITYLINPSGTTLWASTHPWVITWTMFIFQISLLIIMVLSVILFGRYIYKGLKEMDKKDGVLK